MNKWHLVLSSLCFLVLCSCGLADGQQLYTAAEKGDLAGVKAALQKGALVDYYRGAKVLDLTIYRTPLQIAAARGHLTVVKHLVISGAKIDKASKPARETPLMKASAAGHVDIVKFLLSKGAKIDAQTKWGKTALMWASQYGRMAVVDVLTRAGADPTIKDNKGDTAQSLAKKPRPGRNQLKSLRKK